MRNRFYVKRPIDRVRRRDLMGDMVMTKRIEITVPEPVYNQLRRSAQANVTSIGEEARTALVRGTLIEWRADEIAMGASMSALAMNTGLPLEVVLDALEPVTGQGSPLKGY
jgi:hypothetical protein